MANPILKSKVKKIRRTNILKLIIIIILLVIFILLTIKLTSQLLHSKIIEKQIKDYNAEKYAYNSNLKKGIITGINICITASLGVPINIGVKTIFQITIETTIVMVPAVKAIIAPFCVCIFW